MRSALLTIMAFGFIAVPGKADDLTWRKDIQPLISANCAACHGASSPVYEDWKLDSKALEAKRVGPRMDTYPDFMRHMVWPATGAIARRLDDGKNTGGKPGNMYMYLGATDEERAKNLTTIKDWLGEGAWNLNRWEARGAVPAVTKDQMDKIKAKY